MSVSSRSPRDTVTRKPQNKISLACVTCRKKKVRCSGTVPCEYCHKRGLDCSIPARPERRVYSAVHVRELQNRLAQYERDGQGMGGWLPETIEDPPHPLVMGPDAQTPQSAAVAVSSPTSGHSHRGGASNPLKERSIAADSSLSSSSTFSHRVQSLLNHARHGHVETPQATPTACSSEENGLLPKQACIYRQRSLPPLPKEPEAYRLLQKVTLYIGQSQNHFDVREVSDNIELYYAEIRDRPEPPTPWLLRMLIILAVGKLLSGDNAEENGDTYPGKSLFEFVHTWLPTPSEQYSQGRVAIETLSLLGVYLQNMNRKEDAYIYTSIALRLAITHGYHRPIEGRKALRWEKAHIGRLWWTIYMQERRLAAATGNPYGIDDGFITLDYPVDHPGFNSSAPIRTNAMIARVTSRILIDLYSPRRQSQASFVLDVKQIIACLRDISKEIPENLGAVATGPNPKVAVRTTASLQLMLYQATLLTIRPVMLHVAHLILTGEKSSLTELGGPSLVQLCRACTEAARRALCAILTLRKMNILAIYGFFDCDAIFSAAFVLILTVVFDSACEEKDKVNPSPGLDEALESLQYLAENGNANAIERLQEVQQVWHHLSEHFRLNGTGDDFSRSKSRPAPDNPERFTDSNRQAPEVEHTTEDPNPSEMMVVSPPGMANLGPKEPELHLDAVEHNNIGFQMGVGNYTTGFSNEESHIWIPLAEATGTLPNENLMPMAMPADECYSLYQPLLGGSDWDLTGQDARDLAEFERHVVNFNRSM